MAIQTIIKSIDPLAGRVLSFTVSYHDDTGQAKDIVRTVPVTNTTEAGVRAALRAERDTITGFQDVSPKIPIGVPYDIDVDVPQPPTLDEIAALAALQDYRAAYSFFKIVRQQRDDGIALVDDKVVSDALADLNKKFLPVHIGK